MKAEPVASAFDEGARPRAKNEPCPWCDAAPGEPCLSLMGRKLRYVVHYVKDVPLDPTTPAR